MRTAGFDKPLYILPFDHRHSYGAEVFGFKEPMTPEQIAQVGASKQVIYEGFKKSIESGQNKFMNVRKAMPKSRRPGPQDSTPAL